MSWNYDTAKKRVEDHRDNMPSIEIKKLERDADLESLLSESVCREIFGAHLYLDIANFSSLTDTGDAQKLKKLLRAIHIYQRQLGWIVESKFDGVRVHFQAARMHVVFYRPIDDAQAIAAKAVLLLAVVHDFLLDVFNPRFPTLANLSLRAGADIGTVIGTRNGMKGDRELLFLGAAANQAAKMIDGGQRLSKAIYDALPKNLQEICEIADVKKNLYRLIWPIGEDNLVALTNAHNIAWDRDEAGLRVDADLDAMPLSEFEFSSAEELIDFDLLSYRNNKKILGASIFGDVSGFTKYVASATTDGAKVAALKALHIIRAELARVATIDVNGVRVQFHGDRIQVLVHLPEGNAGRIARKAVDLAVGMQSSMELVIKDVVEGIGELGLAVGVDIGEIVATRLGQRGHRDRLVLGASVIGAAGNEERTEKRQIGVATGVYDKLEAEMKERFTYSNAAVCYVATSLTVSVLEKKAAAAGVYQGSAPVVITSSSKGLSIEREEGQKGGNRVVPARSYGG